MSIALLCGCQAPNPDNIDEEEFREELQEAMPAEGEQRGEIGAIKPSGWHTVKYPDVISDLYLYNRCHLIGWQLGAENDNELNLMTGTEKVSEV